MTWEWTPAGVDHLGDSLYDVEALAAAAGDRLEAKLELGAHRMLLVRKVDFDVGLHVALFDWTQGEGADSRHRIVFRGEGISGGLRELRHTWWGGYKGNDERGYIYYPSLDLIEWAMRELRRWFD